MASLSEAVGMETATQLLHRLTSYEPGREWDEPIDDPRVLQDLVANDIDRLPWFYKRYDADLPRTALPRDLPTTTARAVAVMAGTAVVAPSELDLAQLARILHLSAGVVRTMERPYGTYLFRAAGSAGGRFPIELYVSVPENATSRDVPAGVHWYDPLEHALVQIGPPPTGGAPCLIVTGIPWRTGWRYRERGYRHIYWDSGTMLAQTLVAADSAGIPAELFTRFSDLDVAALVGVDRVHEFPVAVVSLGSPIPALTAGGPAVTGEVDASPVEFPLVTAAQRAGECAELGSPWERGAPVDVAAESVAPVEQVVLSRGSQRLMDPTRSLPDSTLRTCLGVALLGIDVPHFVAVHDVDGMESGIYRWPDLASPLRSGMLRDELFFVSLEQGLARDAAFVVIAATNVSELSDVEYREAQLAGGIVEGRLHLLAYALGASASGMTFLDSEMASLLATDLDGLIFTCVGVPEYVSAVGGQPGAPVEVRRVEGR